MKLWLSFLVFTTCTSCAYLKNDAVIQQTEAENWQKSEDALVYACKDEGDILVSLNQKLATEGSTYLLFGIIPVGEANFSDRNFNLSIIYKSKSWVCDKGDVSLLTNNKVFPVSKLWPQENFESMTRCTYSWSKNFLEHSEITVNFNKNSTCNIPPIKLFYEKKLNYKYDSIAG